MRIHFSKTDVITATTPLRGWLSQHEAVLLFILASQTPIDGEIVEIGSFEGKSTIALAMGSMQSGKPGQVWAIDPHEGVINSMYGKTHTPSLQAFQKNIARLGLQTIISPLVMTSKKASKQWKLPIRLLFLDGLHDYDHTLEDYRLWSRHVVPGGMIAFHDAFCGETGVRNVIENHVLRRKDIIDIGTATSILYILLGKPTTWSRIRVSIKKQYILFANTIHTMKMPWIVKKIIIHRIIRLLLLTRYTRAIYDRVS